MNTRAMCMVTAVTVMTGCLGSNDDGAQSGGGGGGGSGSGSGSTVTYESFTTRTRSLGTGNGDHFLLSLTDATGQIACGLGNDFNASLGTAGHQVMADLGYVAGYPCPTGSYTVTNQNCPTNLANEFQFPEGCAYYRAFDATGASLGVLPATAGNITVSGTDASCSISVSLSFSGQPFSTSFTLANGLTAQPWCQ